MSRVSCHGSRLWETGVRRMANGLDVTIAAAPDAMQHRRTRGLVLAELVKKRGGETSQIHSIHFLAGTKGQMEQIDIPRMTRKETSVQPGN